MDISTFESLRTVVLLLAFLAIVIWAWRKKRKRGFDEAARLPLEEDRPPNPEEHRNE
ncbi:MAG: cbb3-type cytochrome c oxidase subunit 3 [Pseudomonadota bacterium]